jgi:SAM-dependent methyltransferase/biotin operon repressor
MDCHVSHTGIWWRMASDRAELFRLLGDEDRLRLLALCAADELMVGELSALLGESQPQVTKKSQPLRDAGLLIARRDGGRTLLSTPPTDDAVVRAALEEGRALSSKDGSLARVPKVVAQREESSRRYFAEPKETAPVVVEGAQLLPYLPMLAPLLPARALAVDLGTGEGALLSMLAPLYERVIAVDASAARLARCAARLEALGLGNVRLLEADAQSPLVAEEVARKGGADLVALARVLQHVARPQDVIQSAARLLKHGAHLALIERTPHDDESARERGAVWLGFEPARLQSWLEEAGLRVLFQSPIASGEQVLVAQKLQ